MNTIVPIQRQMQSISNDEQMITPEIEEKVLMQPYKMQVKKYHRLWKILV